MTVLNPQQLKSTLAVILIAAAALFFFKRLKKNNTVFIQIQDSSSFYEILLTIVDSLINNNNNNNKNKNKKKTVLVFDNQDLYNEYANYFKPIKNVWTVRHPNISLPYYKIKNRSRTELILLENNNGSNGVGLGGGVKDLYSRQLQANFFIPKPTSNSNSKKIEGLEYSSNFELFFKNVIEKLKISNNKEEMYELYYKDEDLVYFLQEKLGNNLNLLLDYKKIENNARFLDLFFTFYASEKFICSRTSDLGKAIYLYTTKNQKHSCLFYSLHEKNRTCVLSHFNGIPIHPISAETFPFHFHAVTFGTIKEGMYSFQKSLNRVKRELENTGLFSSIHALNETSALLQPWKERHKNFHAKRGYKYWIWKPYIILKILESIPDGDYLLFVDSGDTIFNSELKKQEFLQMVVNQHNRNTGIFMFSHEINHFAHRWTKSDLYVHFGLHLQHPLRFIKHREGGHILMKKCKESVELITRWYETACLQNYHLVDDSPSMLEKNHPEFKEHRHDQSIFSILTSLYNLPSFDMEVIAIASRLRS